MRFGQVDHVNQHPCRLKGLEFQSVKQTSNQLLPHLKHNPVDLVAADVDPINHPWLQVHPTFHLNQQNQQKQQNQQGGQPDARDAGQRRGAQSGEPDDYGSEQDR